MAILSDDDQQRFMEAVGGEEQEPEQPLEETEYAGAEPEAADEDSEDLHHVPYSRFKSVIDTRNDLRSQMQSMEEELLYFREQAEQSARARQYSREPEPRQSNEEDPWGYLNEGEDNSNQLPEHEGDHRIGHLEARLEQAEEGFVMRELEMEVSEASHRHGVPTEMIYNAISTDGSLSADDIARTYNEFVHEIEEAALSRYKSEAAPRVRTSSGPTVSGGTGGHSSDSMDDARSRLLAFLKD